jgi:hypothetical protein
MVVRGAFRHPEPVHAFYSEIRSLALTFLFCSPRHPPGGVTYSRAGLSGPGPVGPSFQRRQLKAYCTGQRFLKLLFLGSFSFLAGLPLVPLGFELLDQSLHLLLPLLAQRPSLRMEVQFPGLAA